MTAKQEDALREILRDSGYLRVMLSNLAKRIDNMLVDSREHVFGVVERRALAKVGNGAEELSKLIVDAQRKVGEDSTGRRAGK